MSSGLSVRELEEAKAAVRAALADGRISIATAPCKPDPEQERARRVANRFAVAAWRARCRAEGRCAGCGGELHGVMKTCDQCRTRQQAADLQRRTLFLKKERCSQCGGVRDHTDRRTGKLARQCSICRARNEAAKARQRERLSGWENGECSEIASAPDHAAVVQGACKAVPVSCTGGSELRAMPTLGTPQDAKESQFRDFPLSAVRSDLQPALAHS